MSYTVRKALRVRREDDNSVAIKGRENIFSVALGAKGADYGMNRRGAFSVLDSAEAARRSGNMEAELDRRVQMSFVLDGKPAKYQYVTGGDGRIYRTDGNGRIRHLDETVLNRARDKRKQIDEFINYYLERYGDSDDSGCQIFGCTMDQYRELTRSYPKGANIDLHRLASWFFPPDTFLPVDLVDVECSASSLRYLVGERRAKGISRVMFMLEHGNLPEVVGSGMSADQAAKRDYHVEDPEEPAIATKETKEQ